MQVEATELPGVVLVTPRRYGDERGWFSETWNAARMKEAGLDYAWVQDNHAMSGAAGTLRGLHYQAPPHAQDKLVRCSLGAVFDVAVDFRRGSPTFGKWVGVEISAENGRQMLVPKGFLHGYVTRTARAEVQYKCTDFYAPDCDAGVRWDDPDIGVVWGLTGEPVLSEKDRAQPLLREAASPFRWEGRP